VHVLTCMQAVAVLVVTADQSPTVLARPKSLTAMRPSSCSSMLSGFRSLRQAGDTKWAVANVHLPANQHARWNPVHQLSAA
jgi:hypothetical protein